MRKPRTALVLSGGGARGAYQAGVLQGFVELGVLQPGPSPFDIFVGTSAGSINVTILAAYADRLDLGVQEMNRVWSKIRARQVFRTDLLSFGRVAWQWIRDLSFGGLLGNVKPKSLLDTTPLRAFLSQIPFERIEGHIREGLLHAVAVGATNYYSANGVLFMQGQPDIPMWSRPRYQVERCQLRVDHLLASSAIPFFFPSVEIDGRHLGDGSVRNTAPLSPAIRLGAERVVAIGVRETGSIVAENNQGPQPPPSIAHIAGSLLDAVMLDAIEVDVNHSERVNLAAGYRPDGDERRAKKPTKTGQSFRHIDVLWLTPSRSFAPLAKKLEHHIPFLVRYLLRGLGNDAANAELASYLLFDATFCRLLIEQGRADALARADEIRAFFEPALVR